MSGACSESVPVSYIILPNNIIGYLILLCLRKYMLKNMLKNVIMQVRVSHDVRTCKVLSKYSLNL